MRYIYYHVSSDQHNEYLDSLEDAKSIAAKWNKKGDTHIKVIKTTKKEDGDAIFLTEAKISSTENFNF